MPGLPSSGPSGHRPRGRTAKESADEAKAEYDALKASAGERKAAIAKRLEALA